MRTVPARKQQPPQQPQPKYRFRWAVYLGIPLTVAAFIYIVKNIDPSFQFEDILDRFDITFRIKYARLACLAVLCLSFLLIAKLSINKPE